MYIHIFKLMKKTERRKGGRKEKIKTEKAIHVK